MNAIATPPAHFPGRRFRCLAACLLALMIALPFSMARAAGGNDNLKLTPEQRAAFQKLAPGVKLTPQLIKLMQDITYNPNMPVDERLKAISKLSGLDQLPADQRLKRKICIWDIAGRSGPVFQAALDQKARALQYGLDLQMVPYTDERVMVEDFKAHRCDAALMSGLRARLFNKYVGTINAIGAIPDEKELRTVLRVASNPKLAGKMVSGPFVVLGIYPAGGAYIFVDDRSIDTLANAAGKKVAVLDYDKTQAQMVAAAGATPVPTDFVHAPGMFNNGVVDVLAAPLVAYQPLELYKGMTPNGGIIKYPLAQITMVLVGYLDKFPNAIAQLVREESFERYDDVMVTIHKLEEGIPSRWWITVPAADQQKYDVMMQTARLTLRNRGYYDGDMLTLERKVRCKYAPSRPECANPQE